MTLFSQTDQYTSTTDKPFSNENKFFFKFDSFLINMKNAMPIEINISDSLLFSCAGREKSEFFFLKKKTQMHGHPGKPERAKQERDRRRKQNQRGRDRWREKTHREGYF